MGAAPSQPVSSTSITLASTSSIFSSSSLLPSTTSLPVLSSSTPATSSAVASTTTPVGPYLPIPYQDPSTQSNAPSRKDINTLSTEELSLFVLAYQQWQKVSAGQVGGYFQVAGIHGAPHQYWDNAGGYGTTSTGNKNTGYCFHGDQNFYLWHRPYLALVEQQMRAFAVNISNSWYAPQRATYQAVAANLRHPYWDWAKSSTVPATLSAQQITIVDPTTGQSSTITNPLYSYTLVSDGNLGKASNGASITVSSNSRTTNRGSNYQANMQSAGASLTKNTALLFNTPNVCWNVFATYNTNEQQQCSSSQNVASLESIHNTVHNTIAGTMANLDVAAFDPIFWLHHCNVDRIGAIWQAINPGILVQATSASDSTYVAGPGVRSDSFQYLPFRGSQGNTDWWTVTESYNTRSSGYTYPELADSPSPSTALSRVNAIYGNGRTQSAISSTSAKFRARRVVATQPKSLNDPPCSDELAPYASVLISSNGSFNEYAVTCEIQKSVASGVSFDLHLFFGTVKDTNYLGASNRVGGFSVSQSGSSSMTTTVTGVVPITDGLLNKLIAGEIKDLKPDTVQKYVDAKLIWRLVTSNERDIGGNAASNGLVLTVKHTVVTPKAADEAAQPVVAAPQAIADTTNNTIAKPLPSGVAASTFAPQATDTVRSS